MEGQVIQGRYRLVRVLGKGGMGSVWLAEHLSLHTPVAIKLIDFEAAKNPSARSRFDREAQVAARIKSAHVVKVLDHGVTEEGLPYIAMECLTGESLRDRITARGRLTAAETARVVSHVGRALQRAHEAGLVHRDLKPENIFIAREDDDEIVKILDFGVAKVTDILAVTGMDPTRTGALLGTPYYMSPEQAQGLKTVDHRSDLWSLAVVAFECLTGKRPFTAPALGPLIGRILGGPVPVPSQAAPDAKLTPEIDAWMVRALARDPAARAGSAKELADSFLLAAGVADTLDRGGPMSAVAPSRVAAAGAGQAPDPDEMATVALEPQAVSLPIPLTTPSKAAAAASAAASTADVQARREIENANTTASPGSVATPLPAPAGARPQAMMYVLIGLVVALSGAVVALLLRR
jgi:eukaryotic-like serine/threonine-protein kinase